jgi:hypothetical protein
MTENDRTPPTPRCCCCCCCYCYCCCCGCCCRCWIRCCCWSRFCWQVRNQYAIVEPGVTLALKGVRRLRQTSLDEIRLMPSPPHELKLAVAAMCVMLGELPELQPGLSMVDAYWEPAMRLLRDCSDLIATLSAYRKDAIPDIVMNRMAGEPFMGSPEFDFRRMRKVSKSNSSSCGNSSSSNAAGASSNAAAASPAAEQHEQCQQHQQCQQQSAAAQHSSSSM